jgi:hypothetical protein
MSVGRGFAVWMVSGFSMGIDIFGCNHGGHKRVKLICPKHSAMERTSKIQAIYNAVMYMMCGYQGSPHAGKRSQEGSLTLECVG